jgi:hypothetical protein
VKPRDSLLYLRVCGEIRTTTGVGECKAGGGSVQIDAAERRKNIRA